MEVIMKAQGQVVSPGYPGSVFSAAMKRALHKKNNAESTILLRTKVNMFSFTFAIF